MAVELAVAFVSIVPDTKRVRPGVKKAFQDVDGEAESAGKRHGQGYSKGFTSGISKGTRGIAAGFGLASAAVSGTVRHIATVATVLGVAARLARHFSIGMLAGATALRAVAGVSLARLAGMLRIIAAIASRVAQQVARITSAFIVLMAVARVVSFMTNFARTLAKITIGAALAIGVISGLATIIGGAFVSGAMAAAAAAGILAGAIAGIAGPALGVLKVAFKGMTDGAKAYGQMAQSGAAQSKAVASAAKQMEQAEKGVQRAKRDSRDAEQDLTRARKDAEEQIEDLNLSLKGAALSERDAQLSLLEARRDLQQLGTDGQPVDMIDRQRAVLRVQEAEQRLAETRESNSDLAKEAADADAKGVEGSDQVVAAKQRVVDANEAVVEAVKQVTEAQQAMIDAQNEGAGGTDPFAAMIGQRMGPMLDAFKSMSQGITDSFTAPMVPAFITLGSLIDHLSPKLNGLSGIFGNIGKDITDSIAGPVAKKGFDDMIAGSSTFFSSLRQGESGLGGLTSGLTAFLGTASQAFAGSGGGLNAMLLSWGESLRNITGDEMRAKLAGISQVFTNIGNVLRPIVSLFMQMGQESAAGLAPGFVAIGNAIKEATPGLVNMASILMPALGKVMTNLAPIIPALVQAFTPWASVLAVLAPAIATVVTALAPFAPLLLTLVTVFKAVGIAMTIYNAAMLFFTNVTKIATGIQWLWNAALAANPIGIIIIAIAALVGALVVFFTKTEVGRKLWTKIWAGIKTAVAATWEFIKPVWDAMLVGLQWIGDKAVWLWQNVMLPAWTAIKTIIGIWWAAVKVYFDVFISVMKAIGTVIMWLWNNVVSPAFKAIGFIFDVWWAGAQIVFKLFKLAIGVVGDVIMFLWRNVAEPAFTAIGAILSAVWNGVIKPVWDQFTDALHVVGDAATWLWNKAITPAWDGIKSAISTVWTFIKPIFQKIGDAFNLMGDIAGKVGSAMKGAFDGVVDIIKKPLHVLGGLLSGIPTSVLGVDIPGASAVQDWGASLQGLKYGGFMDAAPGGFVVNARASRKHRGLLDTLGGQRISGPGSGTSDSIAAMMGGRAIARVSNGETYFGPGLAGSIGGLLGAINGGFGMSNMLAAGGSIPYGLPSGSNGSGGFPDWVKKLEQEWGVKASTYAGHQESDRNEVGYAPNPQHLNRGIDWGGTVDAMQKFAAHLLSIAPNTPSLEQVIWQNPSSGEKIGWAGRKADTDGSYFAADYSGHQNHVHTRQSASLDVPSSPIQVSPKTQEAVTGPSSTMTAPAEAFSSAQTTRDFLGTAGKIAGESLFDIFNPGFSNMPDPVALADRYTIKPMNSQSSALTSDTSTASAVDAQPVAPGDKDYVGHIAEAAKKKNLGIGAAIIGVGTALTESALKMYANSNVPESLNYPHDAVGSDHDSLNYMQQRVSMGWGTVAQLMSPSFPAEAFMGALVKVNGWESMDKGAAAQAVQRSAFGSKYAGKMAKAEELLKGKFDQGGMIPPGLSLMDNQTKRYEPAVAFNPQQWSTLNEIAGSQGGTTDARMIIEKLVVQDWREARKELKSMGTRHAMRYGGRPSS